MAQGNNLKSFNVLNFSFFFIFLNRKIIDNNNDNVKEEKGG